MARREIIQYFDDIDNSPLTDNEVNIIRFSVDGNHYVIDLSEDNAAKFRAALQPWIDAAQPDPTEQKSSGSRHSGPSAAARRERSRAIRAWARANGYTVSDRGKIPASIIEAYDKAGKANS